MAAGGGAIVATAEAGLTRIDGGANGAFQRLVETGHPRSTGKREEILPTWNQER
jgi:hypothetical protein